MEKDWVDFRSVKAAISFQMVLDHYGINWLRKNGNELRGRCPIHQGDGERTFHINESKKAFNCFSCKSKGNVLDFVAAMERCSVREAALKLREWFGVGEPIAAKRKSASGENSAKQKSKSRKATEKKNTSPKDEVPAVINPPLTFQLRVDMNHNYGQKRGLTKETLEVFGAGVCVSKGMFAGRFVFPLHDEQGRMVGYAGRSLDDSDPKYLFPSRDRRFFKSHLLFNLHRVIAPARVGEAVVVVEGFFDVLKVHQSGFPVVGLLGSSLSEEQEELLTSHFRQIILFFDGDDAGRACTEDSLTRLAHKAFVKVVCLADGSQPDLLNMEEIYSLIRGD